MQENWPGRSTRRACGCARCAALPWWRDPRRRIAYAHSQNRLLGSAVEASLLELAPTREAGLATGGELRFAGHFLRREPRRAFTDVLADRNTLYTQPNRQWIYTFYLQKDRRPLYIGKADRSDGLMGRLRAHARNLPETGSSACSPNNVTRALATAAGHRTKTRKAAKGHGDQPLLYTVGRAVGRRCLDLVVSEVVRDQRDSTGRHLPGRRGAALLFERMLHFLGKARINRPDRAEEEAAAETIRHLLSEHQDGKS